MKIKVLGHYLFLPMLMLGLVESLALFVAHILISTLLRDLPTSGGLPYDRALLFTACALGGFLTMGLYSQRLRDRVAGVALRVTLGLLAGGMIARMLSPLVLGSWIETSLLGGTLILSWPLVLVIHLVGEHLFDRDLLKRRILVVGAGNRASQVLRLRRRADRRGFRIFGFVVMEGDAAAVPSGFRIQRPDSLFQFARAHGIQEIVVAMDDRRRGFPFRDLLDCRIAGIVISELGTFLERETGKVFLDVVDPSWLIFGSGFRNSWLRRCLDRAFDLLVSAVMLLIASPFMLLVYLAIKLEDGWAAPALYRQERVGQYGRVFKVLKFRSMRLDAEKDGRPCWAQKNDPRITRVGALMRRTRLDELPQLLNVLKGTMSFVGPRPERPTFVEHLGEAIPYYGERHSVKPGITGWAQLCYPYGGSDRDAMEKLQYDLFYVKNHGLMFDALILLQTIEVILFGKGAR
jgi:sugar transferase (PEP-CTERM system associated)